MTAWRRCAAQVPRGRDGTEERGFEWPGCGLGARLSEVVNQVFAATRLVAQDVGEREPYLHSER